MAQYYSGYFRPEFHYFDFNTGEFSYGSDATYSHDILPTGIGREEGFWRCRHCEDFKEAHTIINSKNMISRNIKRVRLHEATCSTLNGKI